MTKYTSKLSYANSLFKKGYYEDSIALYEECALLNPSLGGIYSFNAQVARKRLNRGVSNHERVAVFAGYSNDCIVEDYVVYYLSKLKEVASYIIYVCDNPLSDQEKGKLAGIADVIISERHEEYDFGSYKRGFLYLKKDNKLENFDELIFCNDSCYGPIESFKRIFNVMNRKKCDFWGLTQNSQFSDHLQSFFLVFRKPVLEAKVFHEFIAGIEKQATVQLVITEYETRLTGLLASNGFKWKSYVENEPDILEKKKINSNLTVFPSYLLSQGVELVKVKALKHPTANFEGIKSTVDYIKGENTELLACIRSHNPIERFENFSENISVVIATFNRARSICNCIKSVLSQSSNNYEIIVVDDCSTDNTGIILQREFQNQILSGTIVYHKNSKNIGPSASRNIGINLARYEWIAYLDADNTMKPHFISVYSDAIAINKDISCFYAKFATISDGKSHGQEYSQERLRISNYIDLNTVVHKKDLLKIAGGFDEKLKRLVDWDFIIRLTKSCQPVFIPTTVVDYSDDSNDDYRISNKESFQMAQAYIIRKYKFRKKVTTCIVTYNHQDSLSNAIESACSQKGDFDHEIYIVDDCSTDKTWDVVARYAKQYPSLIKAFKQDINMGQSLNIKQAMTFGDGHFLSLLEGDDYWTDSYKLEQQSEFLLDNYDCSMVFSRILVKNLVDGTERLLKRQDSLDSKLNGGDFISHHTMNVICNFSSCMFRRELLSKIPTALFSERLNEVAMAFFMENFGFIGYINKVMSTYVQHSNGLWSGLTKQEQDRIWLDARNIALQVARPEWKSAIQHAIDSRQLLASIDF